MQERGWEAEPCLSSVVESCLLIPPGVADGALGRVDTGKDASSADKAPCSQPSFRPSCPLPRLPIPKSPLTCRPCCRAP